MNRDQALEILNSYLDNENLKKHSLSVEAAVRFYAKKFGADEDKWGIAGLLHDADWEKYPEKHPQIIMEDLKKREVDSEIIQAISCHGNQFGVQRKSQLDHVLFACDEITGLVTANALVRPQGLEGMKARSVIKKMKSKNFAAGVNRDEVLEGAEEIGVELSEHIQNVIASMQQINNQLGL